MVSPDLFSLDGHHKLVRWKIVTHGGIDGHTRLIVYLQCSANNTAETVYRVFMAAVNQYGLPSRVRSDQGTENIAIARHMLETRGTDRGSMIVGSSVHNQRIERMWKDIHRYIRKPAGCIVISIVLRCVTQLYYRLFYYLEMEGLLDPLNHKHLFALHYVYKPRIQRALDQFKEGWNNHNIRTEHHKTPYQLFVSGALMLQRSGLVALDFFETVNENYGIDEAGFGTADVTSSETVHVSRVDFELSQENYSQLTASVDPLENSSNFGIDLYQRTLQYLNSVTTQ